MLNSSAGQGPFADTGGCEKVVLAHHARWYTSFIATLSVKIFPQLLSQQVSRSSCPVEACVTQRCESRSPSTGDMAGDGRCVARRLGHLPRRSRCRGPGSAWGHVKNSRSAIEIIGQGFQENSTGTSSATQTGSRALEALPQALPCGDDFCARQLEKAGCRSGYSRTTFCVLHAVPKASNVIASLGCTLQQDSHRFEQYGLTCRELRSLNVMIENVVERKCLPSLNCTK